MELYTQRHGMRKPIEKTYDISIEVYTLLFKCCDKYKVNLAAKFPLECADGYGCCGIDEHALDIDLKYAIPGLFRTEDGSISVPCVHHNIFGDDDMTDEYDQYALFDYIEYFANNIRDIVKRDFHSYFGHHHLTLQTSTNIVFSFVQEINGIFDKTHVLYHLSNDLIIERIVEDTPLTPEIEKNIGNIKEKGLRDLLQEAILLYKQPAPHARRDAVEKIWDAFERLKTYYTTMDKKTSAATIVNDMANRDQTYIALFDAEFKALTAIGNDFRIRHHETSKTDITDSRHYDYFFNRCLSLIALAIQYLK